MEDVIKELKQTTQGMYFFSLTKRDIEKLNMKKGDYGRIRKQD